MQTSLFNHLQKFHILAQADIYSARLIKQADSAETAIMAVPSITDSTKSKSTKPKPQTDKSDKHNISKSYERSRLTKPKKAVQPYLTVREESNRLYEQYLASRPPPPPAECVICFDILGYPNSPVPMKAATIASARVAAIALWRKTVGVPSAGLSFQEPHWTGHCGAEDQKRMSR